MLLYNYKLNTLGEWIEYKFIIYPLSFSPILRYYMFMKTQWEKISENLNKALNSGEFKVWIAPLQGKVEGSCVHITAPSSYAAEWITSHHSAAIREAAAHVLDLPIETIKLVFAVAEGFPLSRTRTENTVHDAKPSHDTATHRVITSHVQSNEQASLSLSWQSPLRTVQWRHDFTNFVVGPTNAMAVAAAQDICRQGAAMETLFVSAPSGLGKTHLIHAIGQTLSHEGRKARVGYLTAEDFTSHFVRASRNNHMDAFKSSLRDLDVLMLDDVHFFQGKEKTQLEALATIKSLQSRGSRIVLTSSFTPRELHNVDSQLVSHFCSGFLTTIEKPTQDMRRTMLQNKARNTYQVLLPEPVADMLASRLTSDVRQLESCLNNLILQARYLNREISIELAMSVLSHYADVQTVLDIDSVIQLVCASYSLTYTQLASRSRRSEYVLARNTIFYLMRKYTDMSLQDIGSRFNRRHSTVIKGISSIERELQKQSILGRQIGNTLNLIERNAGVAVR